METLLHTIFAGLLSISVFFGMTPSVEAPSTPGQEVSKLLGGTFQTADVRALFETSIASRISSTDTAFTLVSGTDKDGNALASSTYGFIIDEGAANEEFVLADCTSTACTNATRGVSARTGTSSVAALKFEHRRGASIKMTDAPSLVFAINVFKGRQNLENLLVYDGTPTVATTSSQLVYSSYLQNNYVDKFGAQTISGLKTFSTAPQSAVACATGNDYCNKTYIDAQVVAGGTDSSYTVKGISERATAAEINAKTATGGTGAPLYVNPSDLQYTTYASSTGAFKAATTSEQNLGTTTLDFSSTITSSVTHLHFFMHASSTVPAGVNSNPCVWVNTYVGSTNYAYYGSIIEGTDTGTTNSTGDDCIVLSGGGANGFGFTIEADITNISGQWKYMSLMFYGSPNATNLPDGSSQITSLFATIKVTAPITSISVSSQSAVSKFSTSTYMYITGQ